MSLSKTVKFYMSSIRDEISRQPARFSGANVAKSQNAPTTDVLNEEFTRVSWQEPDISAVRTAFLAAELRKPPGDRVPTCPSSTMAGVPGFPETRDDCE